MKTIETILENLLKSCGCYNEKIVQDKIKKWPPGHSMRDVLCNIGLKNKCFDIDKISEIESYNIFKIYFEKYEDFENLLQNLNIDNREKFLDLSHFYYVWCKDPDLYPVLDDSFKLIVMTSIIEALVSDYSYKEFYDWYCSDCSQKMINRSEQERTHRQRMRLLWDEYKKVHGAIRKVRYFFENYIEKTDQDILSNGFTSLDKKDIKFNKIVEFLYTMRSNFVHNAEIVMLAEERGTLFHIVDDEPLEIKLSIDAILSIFEKGVINYFKNKVDVS